MRTVPAATLIVLLLMQSIADAQPKKAVPAAPPIPNVVLMGKAAAQALKQCSRAAPTPVGGFWTPSPRDIKRLETEAPAFLIRQKDTPRPAWSACARQYAGYVQGGRRMIYVNCAARKTVERDDRQMRATGGKGLDWRHTAFVVCDGGPQFFGMEYDVPSHQFQNLLFNGPR